MTENKRFTNIEHDYENAWIKCNDDGDFMIYAIYKELDESLPSLEDLLNGLYEENKELKKENEQLKLDKQHLHQVMSREEIRHKQFKDKVFDLIDKNLEKDKQYYEMTYEDYLNGRIEVLEDLKKELLDD